MRTIIRTLLHVTAVGVVIVTLAEVETMPSAMPALLVGSGAAIAYVWRAQTIRGRRADHR